MADVGAIEADDGGVESDIGFRELVAEEIGASVGEDLLEAVERVEERADVGLVRFLGRREATLVHAAAQSTRELRNTGQCAREIGGTHLLTVL